MSIYSTWLTLDDEEHDLSCARWRKVDRAPKRGSYATNNAGKVFVPVSNAQCDCGEQGPLIYQGSHVNPSDADARGGHLMVCAIPDHCHPDVRGTDDPGKPVDFLRVSMQEDPRTYRFGQIGSAALVLDRDHVTHLRDTLTDWLDRAEA